MKKLLTLAIACFAYGAFGQVSIKETNVNIDGGKNGFEIEIPYADKKTTEKELKDLFKSWKGSFSDKKGVMKSDDCKNKKMGENTFDVFGTVVENGDEGSKALIAIDLGGAYMSSREHSSQFKVMEAELKSWAIKTATIYVYEMEKQEEKILKDKQKELEDLEKDQAKKEQEIEDYKKKIEDNEKAIEQSKKDQEEKKGEIKTQEGVVQEVIKKKEGIK
jgi:septal ring factor EnvC (AmiA/AmiB activator)